MSQNKPTDRAIHITKTADFRSNYANTVQLRMSQWDVELVFGTIEQNAPEQIDLLHFQGIYLSPQQAKALSNLLTANLAQYEQTFGKIAVEPLDPLVQGQPLPPIPPPGGPVN